MKILGKTNLLWLTIGLLTLLVGYLMLSQGPADNPRSLTYAPILLVTAYCILIPLAILKRNSSGGGKEPPAR